MHKYIAVLLVVFQCHFAAAQVRLPRLVRDSMVLQRDQSLPLWGWASPGEKITITHLGKKYAGRADALGAWTIVLPPTPAGGPYTLLFSGKNTITLKQVLFGDVWFFSGQSNMVHQLNIHDVAYAKDIAEANYPAIRQFLVPTATSLLQAQADLQSGSWSAAVGEAVRPFSAVAFFFAKKLYEKYHIPIGIINASVGGTPIEAWMSMHAAAAYPKLDSILLANQDTAAIRKKMAVKPIPDQAFPARDPGLAGAVKWYDPKYDFSLWKNINIPGYWEDLGHADLNGVVWFSKKIVLGDQFKAKTGRLLLGRIVDADEVYLNGVRIGSTTYQYPQRRYLIPAGLLKSGTNTLVVRVTNHSGKGGFVPDKQYALCTAADTVDISGPWQYRTAQVFYPSQTGQNTSPFSMQSQPSSLFNAMVAPAVRYPVKGFGWYQGESNVSQPELYAGYQQSLIHDWRKQWANDSLPFIFVQLPGFQSHTYLPVESNWALLREAQQQSLSVPRTAMAVAIDLGEWNDIHPDNKRDVGERMSLCARLLAYGEAVEYSGPVVKKVSIEGKQVVISFDHVAGGLKTVDGEQPGSFAIAGADKKFVLAYARIVDNQVVVWNDQVKNPRFVRYAWADNPVQPNLCNGAMLPASPFRTDL
jgi:sialate O-acetylesterase